MMITKHKNPRNEECSFATETHAYWTGDGSDDTTRKIGALVPVTTLIAQFYQVSPWGKDMSGVAFGNAVHKVVASCLNGIRPSVSPRDDAERRAFSAAWQFAKRIHDNNEIVGVEKVLFSEAVGVAGTMDLAFRCNGKIHVCDWKTGDIMLPAKCKFNAPFAHLVADPLTIYSLQCSMYQLLLEIGGYEVNASFAPARMLWLHDENSSPKVDAVPCRDLRREAAMMMAMRSYTPWYCEWVKSQPF